MKVVDMTESARINDNYVVCFNKLYYNIFESLSIFQVFKKILKMNRTQYIFRCPVTSWCRNK